MNACVAEPQTRGPFPKATESVYWRGWDTHPSRGLQQCRLSSELLASLLGLAGQIEPSPAGTPFEPPRLPSAKDSRSEFAGVPRPPGGGVHGNHATPETDLTSTGVIRGRSSERGYDMSAWLRAALVETIA
jgi:hypothetical protein